MYRKATPAQGSNLEILRSRFVRLSDVTGKTKSFLVTQEYQANLPGIADKVYRDQKWWRALMWYNKLTDPFNDVIPGVVLQIPPLLILSDFVSNRNSIKGGMQCPLK